MVEAVIPVGIRLATEDDAQQMLGIYAPYVRDTPITFEVRVPTVEEFRARVRTVLRGMPWFVYQDNRTGILLGYAYASLHRPKEAWQWAAESTIYVRDGHHRRGFGRALYGALFEFLRLQGFYCVYAGIVEPHAQSAGLHHAMGFRRVGCYTAAGFKLGAWHDVGWWELALRGYDAHPSPPRAIAEVMASPEWRHVFERINALLTGHVAD